MSVQLYCAHTNSRTRYATHSNTHSTCVREYESECVNCCYVASTSVNSEKHVSHAKWKKKKKSRLRPYTYFDFCLDIGEPLIHPRRNRVVVIRVLDLHDALHCVSFFAEYETGKETERKKREKKEEQRQRKTDLRPHSEFTRPMISLDLEQVPVAIHSLSPHRDLRDFKDPEVLASPSNFTVLRKSERSADDYRRFFRNSPLSATRILAQCGAWTCAEREREKKRSKARTGPNWCCGPPECLAGLRGFRYLELGVGRM